MQDSAIVEGIEEALAQCGVTDETLSEEEKRSLDRLGYVLFPSLLDREALELLRERFEAAVPSEPEGGRRATGTCHADDLAWRDGAFLEMCLHPRVLAAAREVLRRPFRLFQASGRDPLPGFGRQGLHTDWHPRNASDPFSTVTALWLLDDFTSDNGATRLIPGSHRWVGPLPKGLRQPESDHPGEVRIVAAAGSALVFNGHLCHSGTRNDSHRRRRVVQCQFLARELFRPGASGRRTSLPLTPASRVLLGL